MGEEIGDEAEQYHHNNNAVINDGIIFLTRKPKVPRHEEHHGHTSHRLCCHRTLYNRVTG